jgi:CRISPR/Cas system CMR-associated protein Cmr5 small subunit
MTATFFFWYNELQLIQNNQSQNTCQDSTSKVRINTILSVVADVKNVTVCYSKVKEVSEKRASWWNYISI